MAVENKRLISGLLTTGLDVRIRIGEPLCFYEHHRPGERCKSAKPMKVQPDARCKEARICCLLIYELISQQDLTSADIRFEQETERRVLRIG